MTDFLFVYEHVNREIENDVLIMHELEKRGYSCELISFYGPDYVKRRLLRKKAKVVIVPWLRFDEDLRRFISLANKPNRIVNIQCEQVSSEMSAPGMAIFSEACKNAYHFCWGNNRRETLLKDGIRDDKISVVGAVQLDYGKDLLREYYYSRESIAEEFHLDKSKKWVLFISSFSYSGYSEAAVEAECRVYGEQFRTFYQINIESQKEVLNWLCQLCREEDIELIYRPHPSEAKTNNLTKLETSISGFHVIDNYSVKQWANVCDYTSLWFSTSNAELFSLGIDYKVLRPYKIPMEFDVGTFSQDEFLSSYEEFKNSIKIKNKNETIASFRTKVFDDYYSFNNEIYAYRTVAIHLIEVLNSKPGIDFIIGKKTSKVDKNTFIKDIIRSWFYKFDKRFPSVNIIDIFPFFSNDTKNLMKTRSINYRNKNEAIQRMKRYLIRHDS